MTTRIDVPTKPLIARDAREEPPPLFPAYHKPETHVGTLFIPGEEPRIVIVDIWHKR